MLGEEMYVCRGIHGSCVHSSSAGVQHVHHVIILLHVMTCCAYYWPSVAI